MKTGRDGVPSEETTSPDRSMTLLVVGQLAAAALTQGIVMAQLGPTRATDVWLAASAVPVALGAIWAVVVQGIWQWRFAVDDASDSTRMMGEAVGHLALWTLPVALIAALVVRPWFLTVPGWSVAEVGLALLICRIGLVTAVLGTVVQLQSFFWRGQGAHQRVERAMFLSAGVAMVCTLLALGPAGVLAPVIGGVLQMAVAIGLLWPPRDVIRTLRWRPPTRVLWHDGLLLIASAAVTRATIIVDRFIVVGAPVGALTVFTFANGVAAQLGVIGARVIAFPAVAAYLRARRAGDARSSEAVERRVARATAWLAGGGIILALGSAGVVHLLGLSVGRLGPDDLRHLLVLVAVLTLTIVPATLGMLPTAQLQADGRQGRLFAIGAAGLLASTAAKIVALRCFGLLGLATAVVFHYVLNGVAILSSGRASRPAQR